MLQTVYNDRNTALASMGARYIEDLKNRTVHLVDTFPPLHSLPRTYLGTFSWTNSKDKYIREVHAHPVQNTYWTPGDIARQYLTYRYENQKRRTSTTAYQRCFCPRHKGVPMYAKPCSGELVYMDMTGAYWNILLSVGWDVDYQPGDFLGVRSYNADFPFPGNKLARNILVSAGLKSRVSVWTGKKLITINGRNKLYNGILWCCVQDILHGFAVDMLTIGAVYVHTDGYILPMQNKPLAYEIAEAWGVRLGVKYEGDGEVYGPSNYAFAEKPRRKPKPTTQREHENVILPRNLDWLRTRYKQLEHRRYID